ncbi:hypothetical protein [Brevundimonas sp. Bb-A]|uniref:hypothetical protein n=1 Tax=Brevundimonas sp. Bb-A TaxID=2560058 RepID=UPI00351AF577
MRAASATRFSSGTAADGAPWAAPSAAAIRSRQHRSSSSVIRLSGPAFRLP